MLAHPGSGRSFELCPLQWTSRCAHFIAFVQWGEKKCNSTDELKNKYSCFRNGCDEWETECFVFKPGSYMSEGNKGALDLRANVECEKHKKAVRGEKSSEKVTIFFYCIGKQIR